MIIIANKVHGRGTVYNPLVTDELLAQVNPENMQLKKDFLAYLRSIDRAKTTLDSYDHDLDYFFCWNALYNGNKFFVDMNKREFARFQDFGLNENGWSSARVRRVKSTLSSLSNYIYNICDDLYESYKPVVRRIESPVNEPVREKTVLSDEEVNELLDKLSNSKFRSSFHLKNVDFEYINRIGIDKIKEHCYDFVNNRLRVLKLNDGKQTPFRGHPVFISQHATATCCRGCIEKWHKIPKNRDLTDEDVNYIVDLIMKWIEKEISVKISMEVRNGKE